MSIIFSFFSFFRQISLFFNDAAEIREVSSKFSRALNDFCVCTLQENIPAVEAHFSDVVKVEIIFSNQESELPASEIPLELLRENGQNLKLGAAIIYTGGHFYCIGMVNNILIKYDDLLVNVEHMRPSNRVNPQHFFYFR